MLCVRAACIHRQPKSNRAQNILTFSSHAPRMIRERKKEKIFLRLDCDKWFLSRCLSDGVTFPLFTFPFHFIVWWEDSRLIKAKRHLKNGLAPGAIFLVLFRHFKKPRIRIPEFTREIHFRAHFPQLSKNKIVIDSFLN